MAVMFVVSSIVIEALLKVEAKCDALGRGRMGRGAIQ
jgi:hypothetical protein